MTFETSEYEKLVRERTWDDTDIPPSNLFAFRLSTCSLLHTSLDKSLSIFWNDSLSRFKPSPDHVGLLRQLDNCMYICVLRFSPGPIPCAAF